MAGCSSSSIAPSRERRNALILDLWSRRPYLGGFMVSGGVSGRGAAECLVPVLAHVAGPAMAVCAWEPRALPRNASWDTVRVRGR
jgi:hypothetical protein